MGEQAQVTADQLTHAFHFLRTRVIELSAARVLYEQLFTQEDRVRLLKRSAAVLFGVFQHALAQQMELLIARLTDPAQSRSQRNLSLPRLAEMIVAAGHAELGRDVGARVRALQDKDAQHLRQRRNKRTVHFDLDVALGRAGTFTIVTWPIIAGIVRDIEHVMNLVQPVVFGDDSMTGYAYHVLNGDGDDLVRLLEMAHAHVDRERARLRPPSGDA